MIRKFLNPSGKLTYEEALRQAGERVENLMKPSILEKGVNNSDSRFKFKEKGTKHLFKKEAERERRMTQGSPTSEIVRIRTKKADPVKKMMGLEEDEFKTEPRVIGMSGADPLMEFYVGGEALGPLFKLLGKGALYGLGRYYKGTNYGNWAAAKLIAPEMNKALISNSLKLVPSFLQYIPLTQQPIKLSESGLTSLKFFERPSKITEAERLGIPKGERNLTISKRDYPVGTAQLYIRKGAMARMDDDSRYASEMFKKGEFEKVHSDETIRIPDKFSPNGYQLHAKTRRNYYFSEADPYANNRLKGNWKNIMEYNDREGDILGKDLPKEFYDYLEQIKDTEIYPNFTNLKSKDVIYPYKRITLFGSKTGELKANEIQSKYVRDFRLYLGHLGYNTSNISDHQILLLLTDLYKMLTKSMNGKTKGLIFWHEGPKYNEVFDFSHTGENTGNMGALGPGNYFSSGDSAYGKVALPYLITGIKETPIASLSMIDKGLIPAYISPSLSGINIGGRTGYFEYLHSSPEKRLTYPQDLRELYENALAKAKERVTTTPIESSRLWIDPALIENSGVAPRLSLTKVKPMEFMLRRNTGIKSLFPHPSTFTRDANGRIVINRIWEDPRVNYKQGGKMNTILFLQKGNEFQKKKYPEIKHERIDGTHIKIIGPDGTSKIMVGESPLENTYPEFAALFPLRLGASLGVGGLPSLAYKLYKYYKGNKPQMYGRFDLGKKKSFSNVLLEENPLPVKILDALPFFKSGNKIRKGEDGFKNLLGNSTNNSLGTRNVSDHNLGRLYDELSKSKIPMNHTTREQFITRSKDVINAINKHFSGPEIPRVFRNALLTVALEETGLNPSNLYLYGIIGGLRNLYLQKFGGRKDSDSITHFIKNYFKGEYKNLGYSPKAIPSNVTDPREILTYYMTNLGDPSFFKRKNKGNTIAWKKWNEWLPIILNSNLIALNDSNFENNKNLFNTFSNESENNLNNVFNNSSENDSYNIVDPANLLEKLNKQSGNIMLSKNGSKFYKQGSKITIYKFKKGNKIHIKKAN